MISLLYDPPVIDDANHICTTYCRKTVGNDHRSSPGQKALQSRLDQGFGNRIDIGGSLVEDQDARVSQHGARNANQLALSNGKVYPAFEDFGLITERQAFDKTGCIGECCCLLNLSQGGGRVSIADIIGDRSGEKKWILRNKTKLAAQGA